MRWQTTGLSLALLLSALGSSAEPYEAPATLDAGAILAGEPLSGRGWRIEPAVRSDGRMNHHRIHGPDGPVDAVGDAVEEPFG